MPIGPKGQKRPADAIGNAVKVMRIATGEESETTLATTPAAELGEGRPVSGVADVGRGQKAGR